MGDGQLGVPGMALQAAEGDCGWADINGDWRKAEVMKIWTKTARLFKGLVSSLFAKNMMSEQTTVRATSHHDIRHCSSKKRPRPDI